MKNFLFIFYENNIIQEIKLRAMTESEAKRLFKLLIKYDYNEIKEIKCVD